MMRDSGYIIGGVGVFFFNSLSLSPMCLSVSDLLSDCFSS